MLNAKSSTQSNPNGAAISLGKNPALTDQESTGLQPATKVLLVEDDEFDAAIITELLERRSEHNYMVTRAKTLEEARGSLTPNRFDIILSDMGLPDSTGLVTIREILTVSQGVPVVVLTGNEDTDIALQAMRLGAQDYLPKSQINNKILERITEYAMQRTSIEADHLVENGTDALTGLINRSELYNRWKRIVARAARDEVKTGVLLIDINHFKTLNEEKGYEAGDALLLHIAKELQDSVLDTDLVARLSNDEFIVILENLRTQKELNSVRDKLQLLLADSVEFENQRINYSVAIGGMLCTSGKDTDLVSVLKRAADRTDVQKAKLTAVA